jgi:hypothetical protein
MLMRYVNIDKNG